MTVQQTLSLSPSFSWQWRAIRRRGTALPSSTTTAGRRDAGRFYLIGQHPHTHQHTRQRTLDDARSQGYRREAQTSCYLHARCGASDKQAAVRRTFTLFGPVRLILCFFRRLLPITAHSLLRPRRWQQRAGSFVAELATASPNYSTLATAAARASAAACRVGEAVGREGFAFGSGWTRM